jgi:hypothetical protein
MDYTLMSRYSTLARLLRRLAVLGVATLPVLGCSDQGLLAVTDPDIVITPPTSAAGALALHNGVILRLTLAVSGTQGGGNTGEALFMFGSLITDEWGSGDTFIQRNTQDQRIFDPTNTFHHGPFRNLNRARVEARVAIDALRLYSPTPTASIGRMFAVIAYANVLMGEHYCNGIPLSEPSGSDILYGTPLSSDSVFALAVINADSAIASTTGSPAGSDSLRVRWLASVVKGRALVDRGQFAAAAAAVAGVADTFHYDVSHSSVTNDNQIWALNNSSRRYTMGDGEGGNGLPFVSANDPRVPRKVGTIVPDDRIFDTAFPIFVIRQGIWDRTSPIRVATGIEARLIEAEAALKASPPDYTTWLAKLNALRANVALYPTPQSGYTAPAPPLPQLADPVPPGTEADRVNLTFYERAFWMYSTGHRLGDLRRLVRQYLRPVESVYPTGDWFKGGDYSDAVNMPVPFQEQNNPNFTQCTQPLTP